MAKVAKKTGAPADVAAQEAVVAEAPVAQEAGSAQPQVPQLTLADLQVLAQAIDIASQRGAYRAGEMGDVGAVYNKLTAFLQFIAKQRQEAGK